MSTLVVVRHGRSTSNAAGTLAGRTPGIVLDEVGHQQAATLGERLAGVRLAAVVCSPLERCQQTASRALDIAGISIEVSTDERVQETDYGHWSGRLLKDLAKEPAWRTVQTAPSQAQFPGGERMLEVRERVVDAVLDWNARLPVDAVWLLVSHGDPISGLLTWALGMDYDRVQSLMVDPASASIIHLPPPGAEAGSPQAIVRVATVNSVAGPIGAFVRTPDAAGGQVGGGVGATGGAPVGNDPTDSDASSTVAP
ncbi:MULTISPECIES: MSMEG_4193 family putative phosphomutase [Aestuariimicrobium]|uniref:MSMEG_4193 family putative phosphomutase n=1 Tax=Aestuariimicrobium TaxID=396388 RepID=UPI0003B4EFD0|nr:MULTISPECIES: MSMEG_4193 family putative phosphomutase [Aestuariimicrobium]CAI9398621.1 phosphoglycerate mutase GpmB [Aestuariimicrobium sp. T2.26MG-19.2B]